MMRGAIVIGRDYGALGVVRSLGRQGIAVWLLEDSTSNASVSRYLKGRSAWPAEEREQLQLLESMALDRGFSGWALFATSDESAATLARHHGRLSRHFVVAGPDWNAMQWAYDKRLTHQLVERLGIANPATSFPAGVADIERTDWTFPVIIKPAVKPKANDLTSAKAWRIDDHETLRRRYLEAAQLIDPATIMVQEMIPGGGDVQFSFVALCDRGRPVAWLTARRTRQYPVDFGKFSTFVETIDKPEIVEPSFKLIEAMNYSGVVEIEYKHDRRCGSYKPIDINARFWAWHSLGKRAGMDFAYLQWRLLLGHRQEAPKAKIGVQWVRGLADVPAAVRNVRSGAVSFGAYLSSFKLPIEPAIFAFDDPAPFVADLPILARRSLRKRSDRRVTAVPARMPETVQAW